MPYADRLSALASPALLCSIFAVAFFFGGVPFAHAESLQLASRLERPSLDGGTDVALLKTSADGRFMVFRSSAPLVGIDDDDTNDIFFIDRETGELLLVSHAFDDLNRPGNGESDSPQISADGSTVVFESRASDLVTGFNDTNGISNDVFLWDRGTGLVTHVSKTPGGDTGNGQSVEPYVDATGSRVAFQTDATDLAAVTDNNSQTDVFVWERATGQFTLASHADSAPTVTADDLSRIVGFDEAGDGVLLRSAASNLVPGFVDTNGGFDFFHWRRTTGTARLVTRSTVGDTTTANGGGLNGILTADGGAVVFTSLASDLVAGFFGPGETNLYRWDTTTGEMQLVSHSNEGLTSGSNGSFSTFSVSEDGSTVAFETTASNLVETDANGTWDIYLWQEMGSTVQLISREFALPFAANEESLSPHLSRDGTTLAFRSDATNLVPGPFTNLTPGQTYFWRAAAGVRLASRSLAAPNIPSNGGGVVEGVTADGEAVLFTSSGTDLVDAVGAGFFAFDIDAEETTLLNPFCPTSLPILDSLRGDAIEPTISDDGRFVAFYGGARPLLDGYELRGGPSQAYVWDRETGEVMLASRSFEGPQISADNSATLAKISGDGSVVLFGSRATNLIPGYIPPASNAFQVFAWHRLTGEVSLVTASNASPVQGANDSGFDYEVSADGNFAVFGTDATDLIAGVADTNAATDLYLWERATGTLQLITAGAVPSTTANGSSGRFALSADGEFVAFSSNASDLVPGVTDLNGRNDVFIWQRSTGTMTLVSHIFGDPTTTNATRSSSGANLSADGSTVVFESSASDLDGSGLDSDGNINVFRWSRLTDTTEWISRSATNLGFGGDSDSTEAVPNADGSAILFGSRASNLQTTIVDDNDRDDIYYWDATTGAVRLVSRSASNPGFAANDESDDYHLSADGSRAIFVSRAGDLIAGGTTFSEDVYSWDLATDEIRLLSHLPGDPLTGGQAQSNRPALSADGLTVAIESNADDVMTGGFDGFKRQVFAWTMDDPVDLELAASPVLDPSPVGEIYSISVDVTNRSEDDAVHAMLLLSLPPGETFVDAVGTDWSCRNASTKLSCRRRGVLPAGQTVDPLVVRLMAPSVAGTSDVRAALTWPGIDLEPTNDSVTITTTFAPDDWGDAPDPGYPTLAASNGASHGFGSLFLGQALDVDVDGQPTADADGDTTDGTLDEDGVSLLAPIVIGESGNIEVVASAPGVLDAWIDWNANGSWNDPGDRVFAGQAISAGINTLPLAAPMTALPGRTFARFRLSSAGIASPTGRAVDGEVEDYAVQVEAIGLIATLTADPTLVPEVGDSVTFDVEVQNTGTQPAQLASLVDDLAGDLNGQGTCATPQTLPPGGTYACSYTLDLSGPVDATETHVVTAAGTSIAFAVAASDEVTVTFFDSIAPVLSGFTTLPDTGDGPLLDCAAVRRAPLEILITFDEELATGAGGVDDNASYRLLRTGPDFSFETDGCSGTAPTDEAVAYDVTYVPGADRFDPSITRLGATGVLTDGLYRLFVCDGLLDLGDNALPGGDIRVDFRVDDGNLFRNGHFDCTADDWGQDPPSTEVGYDPTDADDSAQSGSLLVASQVDTSFGLSQCVPVAPDTPLIFDTQLRFDGDIAVGVARGCSFFGAEGCQDPIDQRLSIDLLLDTGGDFTGRTSHLVTPPGTVSMDCGFLIEAMDGGFDLFLDRTTLKIDTAIFRDGFESGDTSAWSETSP